MFDFFSALGTSWLLGGNNVVRFRNPSRTSCCSVLKYNLITTQAAGTNNF